MTKKLVSTLAVAAFILVILSPFLIVQLVIKVNIKCVSQFGECPSEVSSKLEILNSKNLWQSKSEVTKILKDTSMVSDYSMHYNLPDILRVNLIIKKPLFAIKDSSTGKILLLSKDGQVLSETDSTSLPVVIQNNQIVNLFTLNLILGLYQMYQVNYGTVVDDSLVVDMPGGIRVLFPLDGESPAILLGGLRLVYLKVTTEYRGMYSEVDMRYKNPVLR